MSESIRKPLAKRLASLRKRYGKLAPSLRLDLPAETTPAQARAIKRALAAYRAAEGERAGAVLLDLALAQVQITALELALLRAHIDSSTAPLKDALAQFAATAKATAIENAALREQLETLARESAARETAAAIAATRDSARKAAEGLASGELQVIAIRTRIH